MNRHTAPHFRHSISTPHLRKVYACSPARVECQEYVGKAGDVLDEMFFVVKGSVEARLTKPGKQVRAYIIRAGNGG